MRDVQPRYRIFKAWGAIIALLAALVAGSATAQDPDFTDVDDVLDGRRVLVDVVDLLAVEPLPIGDGSTTNPSRIVLETDDGKVVSESSTSDGVRNCEPSDACINPFPQQERIVRLFNLPYDVRVAVAANANAAGTDCQGANNLTVSVHDLVTGASTSREVSHSGAWLQLGVGDFNFDGYEELVLVDSAEMVVFGAQDVDDPAAGVVFHTTVPLPGAAYRALSQPTVGDINADGIRELIWAGGNKNGSQFVYVASVCPGAVENTVCDSAQPFQIIINPLSFAPVELAGTTCGGPAATVGNFLSDVGDEVLAVFGNSNCSAQARLLDFDGEMRATQLSQIAVGSDTATMLAETARFDWFADTDQAVTVSAGLAVVGQNPTLLETRMVVSVITFAGNGTMTAHQESTLDGSIPIVRGLATGVFGPPPDGFDDPNDFVPQFAVLSIEAESSMPNKVIVYDVDPAAGYLPQRTSTYILPNNFEVSNECGPNFAGSLLQAGDLQGRSVRVGEPEVIRITQSSQPQIIIGAPPMHVDYIKLDRDSPDAPEIVNFTTIPSAFQSSFQTEVTNTAQSANESTTSYSTATKKTDSSTFKISYGKVASLSETTKQVQEQTHDQSVSTAYDTYTSESFDASTSTGFGDQIWFTSQRFNIYAYPVIGQTSCSADDPDCTEESPLFMLFSGPDEIYRETVNGASVEWYQPVHEAGQIFSYPWSLDQLEQRNGELLLLTSETSFFTDDSERTVEVTWSERQGMNSTSSSVDTYSQETDKSTSASAAFHDTVSVPSSESVDTSSSNSFETLNTTSTELGASTGIGIDKPDSFLEPGQYQYRVEPFVFGQPPPDGTEQSVDVDTDIETTGVLETAYIADPTDSLAGPWWGSSPYVEMPDVALNHPQRWKESAQKPESTADLPASCLPLTLGGTDATCISLNDPNPDDIWASQFYWMRGLLVTVGGAAGPQRTTADEGEDIFLQARVYNYSLAPMPAGTEVRVRFYRQQWDHTTNRPIGDSVLVGDQSVDPIPPFNLETNTTLPNWQTVTTSFSTAGMGDAYWIFWVVVWLEDASGSLVAEVPGHGLESVPGTLGAIGDVPIEEATIVDLDGETKTTSFSNNVGFLNSSFYVVPAAGGASTTAVRGAGAGQSRLGLDDLEASPDRVDLGDEVIVSADVLSPGSHMDGVMVFIYEGNPEDGGRLLDVETLSRVRADDRHEVRVPITPTACGSNVLVVIANPGRPTEARATTIVDVVCDEQASDGGDDDDACQLRGGRESSKAWWLLGAGLLLILLRARPKRRHATAVRPTDAKGDGWRRRRELERIGRSPLSSPRS